MTTLKYLLLNFYHKYYEMNNNYSSSKFTSSFSFYAITLECQINVPPLLVYFWIFFQSPTAYLDPLFICSSKYFFTYLYWKWWSQYKHSNILISAIKEVWCNCSVHRSVHLFIIEISSHNQISWKQPQRIFLWYSYSVTMINIIKKYVKENSWTKHWMLWWFLVPGTE